VGAWDTFRKFYEGSAPVRDGVPSADEAEEIDAWPMRRDPKNTVSSGGYRMLDAEGDSRRGARSDGFPVDKSDPSDPMDPGYNGDALDDHDDEEERALRVAVKCTRCGETSKVRLPGHIKLRSAYADEAEGSGRIMRTKCACGNVQRFHAPAGKVFDKRESAVFFDRYLYDTGRGRNPLTRGISRAREAFRKSYFGR
jgi:hypothetical protein